MDFCFHNMYLHFRLFSFVEAASQIKFNHKSMSVSLYKYYIRIFNKLTRGRKRELGEQFNYHLRVFFFMNFRYSCPKIIHPYGSTCQIDQRYKFQKMDLLLTRLPVLNQLYKKLRASCEGKMLMRLPWVSKLFPQCNSPEDLTETYTRLLAQTCMEK